MSENKLKDLEERIYKLEHQRIHSHDILPGEVTQGCIEGLIIFRGLAADRPTDGSTEIQAYLETDTGKLYIYNDSSNTWISTTLT